MARSGDEGSRGSLQARPTPPAGSLSPPLAAPPPAPPVVQPVVAPASEQILHDTRRPSPREEARPFRSRRMLRVAGWLLVPLVIAAVIVAYMEWIRPAPLPAGLIAASGRIEGDETLVAGRRAGRIRELLVREGDDVRPGQVLARLDGAELTARADQARARVRQASAAIAETDAAVAKAEAAEQQAAADAVRFGDLAARGTVSRLDGEHAQLAWTAARRDLAVARSLRMQALAGVAQARALLAESESALGDQVIVAPTSGTVTTRIRSAGEVVAAGAPLATLVDLDQLYLKVYVAERDIGKLRLGLPARVYTDVFPDKPFAATVRQIASRAEFTPKEVQTPDERVKLVFAVKLYLDANPGHALSPGMPADAVIRWRPEAPWTRPRW